MPTNLISPTIWQSIPFGDQDSFLDFLGFHFLWHQALAKATKTPLFAMDDLRTELLRHSDMHTAVDKALLISPPPDLVSYDLSDRASFEGFHQTHAIEHERQRIAAGL